MLNFKLYNFAGSFELATERHLPNAESRSYTVRMIVTREATDRDGINVYTRRYDANNDPESVLYVDAESVSMATSPGSRSDQVTCISFFPSWHGKKPVRARNHTR